MIQDLSGSWCIKGTGESMTRMDSTFPLMHHDPDRSWITSGSGSPQRNAATTAMHTGISFISDHLLVVVIAWRSLGDTEITTLHSKYHFFRGLSMEILILTCFWPYKLNSFHRKLVFGVENLMSQRVDTDLHLQVSCISWITRSGSLLSKRCVFRERKTQKASEIYRDRRANEFWPREKWGERIELLTLHYPLLLICVLAPFFARAKRRIFALCTTETLATRA